MLLGPFRVDVRSHLIQCEYPARLGVSDALFHFLQKHDAFDKVFRREALGHLAERLQHRFLGQ